MQVYIRFIWLLLAFAFVLIHGRNIRLDFDDRFNNDYNLDEERREIYFPKSSPLFTKKFFNMFKGEQIIPYEQDRLSPIARRAKAIIKGDPREFMG